MCRDCWIAYAFAVLLPAMAQAATIHVPAEYPTVQAGIDAASDGDTVLVASGTYAGPGNRDIDFGGRNIVVRSEAGPDSTVIDCEESGRGFVFASGEDSTAVLDGFTVTNAVADSGAGILCIGGSSPTLLHLNLVGNRGRGGGLLSHTSSPHLRDCLLSGNYNELDKGGGVYCVDSQLRMERVEIRENWSEPDFPAEGGGLYLEDSEVILDSVTVSGNKSDMRGGGLYCAGSSLLVRNADFSGNDSGSDGGAMHCYACSLSIVSSAFTGNSAVWGSGGALSLAYCRGAIESSSFDSSVAMMGSGGAIFCTDCSELSLAWTRFHDNYASGGGAISLLRSPTTLDSCRFLRNWADSEGGAMDCENSSPAATGCEFLCNACAIVRRNAISCRSSTPPAFAACRFFGNGDLGSRGTFYCVDSSSSISQSTLAANVTAGDGVIELWGSSAPEITSCIVSLTTPYGPAVSCHEDATPSIYNCCIFGNAGGDSLCGIYSDNIFANPLFCDLADTNLYLHADSPCLPENNPWGIVIGAYRNGCGEVTTWHVDVDSASGIEDGSEAYPFDTIAEGIASASDGDTVLVHPGIYAGEGNVDLDPPGIDMVIRGLAGRDSTINRLPGRGSIQHTWHQHTFRRKQCDGLQRVCDKKRQHGVLGPGRRDPVLRVITDLRSLRIEDCAAGATSRSPPQRNGQLTVTRNTAITPDFKWKPRCTVRTSARNTSSRVSGHGLWGLVAPASKLLLSGDA